MIDYDFSFPDNCLEHRKVPFTPPKQALGHAQEGLQAQAL